MDQLQFAPQIKRVQGALGIKPVDGIPSGQTWGAIERAIVRAA